MKLYKNVIKTIKGKKYLEDKTRKRSNVNKYKTETNMVNLSQIYQLSPQG